jgi:fructokinase
MKKYQVYGIGNALVDKEFEVDDEFFADQQIEKGLMTLVAHEQQRYLLEMLTDKVGIKKRAGGGSAANTLYALSQFGGKAFFTCKVANDEIGDFYLEQLGDQNIETNTDSQRQVGTTGRCLVMVTPDAERTMHTYLGVSEKISAADLDYDAVKNSEYIYIEGYLVTSPSAKDAVIKLKKFAEENGVKTAMTFSDPSMLEYFSNDVNEVLGSGVDLLFCNETEALLWSSTNNIDDACRAMQSKAKQFVITRGAKGSLLYDGEQYLSIEPHSVTAVDTNGAGDMFAGAFLYGITAGKGFLYAGNLASLASSLVVTNFGPRLERNMHQKIMKAVAE